MCGWLTSERPRQEGAGGSGGRALQQPTWLGFQRLHALWRGVCGELGAGAWVSALEPGSGGPGWPGRGEVAGSVQDAGGRVGERDHWMPAASPVPGAS